MTKESMAGGGRGGMSFRACYGPKNDVFTKETEVVSKVEEAHSSPFDWVIELARATRSNSVPSVFTGLVPTAVFSEVKGGDLFHSVASLRNGRAQRYLLESKTGEY